MSCDVQRSSGAFAGVRLLDGSDEPAEERWAARIGKARLILEPPRPSACGGATAPAQDAQGRLRLARG